MNLFRLFFRPKPLTIKHAASRLGQQSQTVRRARKSARIAEHLQRIRSELDARDIANGAQPRAWKYDAGRHADFHAGVGW